MRVNITQSTLANLKPAQSYYDVWDNKITGLHIRVSPHGRMTYRCLYQRGKVKTLGKVGVISLARARDQAQYLLGLAAIGKEPVAKKNARENMLFSTYIEDHYASWFSANRKSAPQDLARLRSKLIPIFGKKALKDIDVHQLEKWCETRLKNGIKPVTLNRDVATLSVALSKAVEWKFLSQHPLKDWKPLKVNKNPKVRYLTSNEEAQLRTVLDEREQRLKTQRTSANEWRSKRNYDLLPDLSEQHFVDHVKPMILLTINTGLRRGELLQLQWDAINFDQCMLSVFAEYAKSGRTRHIPLNDEAMEILTNWHKQASNKSGLVFPNQTGSIYTDIRKPWYTVLKAANIHNFRWHDLRHHFASKLVMKGVDLNTVRELLGHADLTMTLRYAHLAPEHKAKAVALLNE